MEALLKNLKVKINSNIYVKDPESSDLGKRIVQSSIKMIYELGFENFTFRKLGKEIGSNESSIYRYFENKHKLLLYLTSWYWGWMEYRLLIQSQALLKPKDQLKAAVQIVTQEVVQDVSFDHIDEVLLSYIVVEEYSKSYLTKVVDEENKQGYFAIYQRLVKRLSHNIEEAIPNYQFPSSLSSTIIEGALHQHFLKRHFPAMTDCNASVSSTDYFMNLIELISDAHEQE